MPITFTARGVPGGQLVGFVTTISFGYSYQGCSGAKTFSNLSLPIGISPFPIPIEPNLVVPAGAPSFFYSDDRPANPADFTSLSGAFTSSDGATGNVDYGGYSCGDPKAGFTTVKQFTWTAARQ